VNFTEIRMKRRISLGIRACVLLKFWIMNAPSLNKNISYYIRIPFPPIFLVQSRFYGFYISLCRFLDTLGSGRKMTRFLSSHKIKRSETYRFWRNGNNFESSVSWPARIYGGSHISTDFRNLWI
jgi:hypothetical protein